MERDVQDRAEVTLTDLRLAAERLLSEVPEGEPLSESCAALISLGVAVSVTSLDRSSIEAAIDRSVAAGATFDQVQEAISLVSGLGVHSLMTSLASVAARAIETGQLAGGVLDDERQALWDRYVGTDPFWTGFEAETPGFLDAMLRLSPDQFAAFFEYCAVPWKSGAIRARCKELIALASDATPAHRFLPGFRLHLRNAVALGAGRLAVLETLDLAAAAPPHRGTA
ncbi:MAG TPA: carboxymuconolactone decarboxylase family protein [Sphingomonas sp.]